MAQCLLSPSEKQYYQAALKGGIRSDGRGCLSHRAYSIDLGVITLAHGSARLKLDLCDILVAVKLELGIPEFSQPTYGKLFCHVECSASASQEFEGRGAEELNKKLSQSLEQFVGHIIDKERLLILKGEQCWVVYIDVLILAYGGENLISPIVLAVRSALFNTRIPKTRVIEGTQEVDILEDTETLDLSQIPLVLTLCTLGETLFIDPQWQEEWCADVVLLVGVTRDGRISGLIKQGSGTLSISLLKEMMQNASLMAKELHERHERLLEEAHRSLSTKKKEISVLS
jgi:exosome complex component RRP42